MSGGSMMATSVAGRVESFSRAESFIWRSVWVRSSRAFVSTRKRTVFESPPKPLGSAPTSA